MNIRGYASATDPGRRRRQNEDSYVVQPPLFAVADGMGGAQAGEIASRLAASALSEGSARSEGDEARVDELIQEANRRVYQRSNEDAATSGMGTTVTVALVGDTTVTIGHVGDSRAYMIRKGRLEQLTQDHSLVAELVRSGKLSPEEAETHPQRSVITRVLGTDPAVDVDTFTIETADGDLFLLCSDGLSSMVDDGTILDAVEAHRRDLQRAAKVLVEAANRRGGEDNITVVFFEVGDELAETKQMPAVEDRNGSGADDEDTLTGLAVPPELEDAGARHRDDDWVVEDQAPEGDYEREPTPARRRRRRRPLVLALTGLAVLAAVAGLALWGFASAHFIGARPDGRVAVYQGVPWNLGGGVHLYREVYVSPLYTAQLDQRERQQLFDHSLVSLGGARAKLKPYEAEASP
jgi:serine/threonine protein phosphatase PrpC